MAGVAVVTGASGFIASELVKQLLEKGYDVRGTVRSLANKHKVAHLLALGDALPGTLNLYEADLMEEGSFDSVVTGATYVFHTASPAVLAVEDAQRDLVDPAVEGTLNVLGSVARNKATVRRTVLTSSFVAMYKPKLGPSKPPLYDETDWNNESSLSDGPYMFSKTIAEQAAWRVAEGEGLDLVTINPSFVVGPVLSARTDASSIKIVSALLESQAAGILAWLCDVRDVARAHILAAESHTAHGRYLISQHETVPSHVLTNALKARFPRFRFQDGEVSDPVGYSDNSKALKELGLGKLYDPAESIIDMAATLFKKGVAVPVGA